MDPIQKVYATLRKNFSAYNAILLLLVPIQFGFINTLALLGLALLVAFVFSGNVAEWHVKPDVGIPKRFETLADVKIALAAVGFEASELSVHIDGSKSTVDMGYNSFGCLPLHHLGDVENPFETTLKCVSSILRQFDDDGVVEMHYFGTKEARDSEKQLSTCIKTSFNDLVSNYRSTIGDQVLSGPTSFSPSIRSCARAARLSEVFHLCVIITDGQSTKEEEDMRTLEQASALPAFFIFVGVGDSDFGFLEALDDDTENRMFDNAHFVKFRDFVGKDGKVNEDRFAMKVMEEVPAAYATWARSRA
jgi:hypothetical protein